VRSAVVVGGKRSCDVSWISFCVFDAYEGSSCIQGVRYGSRRVYFERRTVSGVEDDMSLKTGLKAGSEACCRTHSYSRSSTRR
jgi:hypothetical protein